MVEIKNCDNIYTSCSCNSYHHCLDVRNNLIAFGSCNFVAIYNLEKRKITSTLKHHTEQINSVRWISGNDVLTDDMLISSSVDRSNIVWMKSFNNEIDDDSYKIKYILDGHQDSIIVADSRFIQSNDGNVLLSGSTSNDKTLRLWLDNQPLLTKNFNCFLFDLKILNNILIPGIVLFTAGSNETVLIERLSIDEKKLEPLISLKGHNDWIKSIDVFPYQDKLMLASASQDFFVRVYQINKSDLPTGVNHQSIPLISNAGDEENVSACLETVLAGHEGWVTGVEWVLLNDQLSLMTCSMDKTLVVWQATEESVWNDQIRFGEVGGDAIGFLGCRFISELKIIVAHSFNGAIHLWQQTSDQQLEQWTVLSSLTGHFRDVTDLTWEPCGQYFLTTSTDQTTRLHSWWPGESNEESKIISWHEIARPQIHGYDLKCLAMVNRWQFVSGADEKIIRIFDATKFFFETLRSINAVEIDFDAVNEKNLAECAILPPLGLSNSAFYSESSQVDNDGSKKPKPFDCPPTEEKLLQQTFWCESKKLYGHGYEIFQLAVSHNSKILASACKAANINHASIIIWNLRNFEQLAKLVSHNLTVTRLRFSHNDRYLLSVSRDRTWALFDMTNLTNEFPRLAYSDKRSGIHTRIIWDCAWTNDSKCFVTASRDKTVVAWYIQEKKSESFQVKSGPLLKFDQAITSVDILNQSSNNIHLVCLALENGHLYLYTLSTTENQWKKIYSFDNFCHSLTINSVRFSPFIHHQDDEEFVHLATCSSDRSVKLFKLSL